MARKFEGFTNDTFEFLSDLAANNSREWFEDNRNRYEATWKSPALDMIDAMAEPMSKLDPPLKAEARINGSLRRINQDVRFSKDKSPYNARLHLIFWAGSHPNRSPVFHFVLSPNGIGYGAGVFGLDASALKTIRNRINNPVERANLLQAIDGAEKSHCSFEPPELKRQPAGFTSNENWEHLLRRKAFVMRTLHDVPTPDWVLDTRCADKVFKIANGLTPLIRWLNL